MERLNSVITELDEETGEWEVVDADLDQLIDGLDLSAHDESLESAVVRQEQLGTVAEMSWAGYLIDEASQDSG